MCWQSGIAVNFNIGKMYSTVEKSTVVQYVQYSTAERIPQTMNDCMFSCQNKCSNLQRMDCCIKEWMTAILSVTKTDALLQRMHDCN